jgi:nicotinamidase-related amidase
VSEWTLTGKPALVVIHMQNAICKGPSPLEFLGHARATEEDEVIAHITRLIDAFRGRGLPVVFTAAVHPDEIDAPAYGMFWDAVKGLTVNISGSRDIEIVDELAPLEGESVVHNWPFDVFRRTGLEERLRGEGVETIVLAGVSTGMAVIIAAYQAADRFFNLIVPADCITDGNRALHEAIMSGIMPVIGLVTTSDDVIAHL